MNGFLAALLIAFAPAQADARADWPQFRGPTGQGHSAAKRLPLEWSETKHVRWKVPIPGRGWSSPAIHRGQIWLTTALDDGRSLRAICVAADTGELVHNVEVFHKNDPGQIHSKNSHASPTPVLEAGRVYVHYGAHGTACLTDDGKVLWRNESLRFDHRHGPGGSPVIWKDLLIASCDGTDVQFLVALDKDTGDIRWRSARNHISEARKTGRELPGMAFSTPLVIDVAGQPQVVCSASDHVVAYNPRTGEEIWWAGCDGYSNVPRPVYGHGMVYVCSGYGHPTLYAVRVDGRGDVTGTHIAWKLTKAAPLNPSPLLVDELIYVVSDSGIVTCLDAKSGRRAWQKRLGGNFSASPIFADGRIWLLDEGGTTTVIAPGKKFESLAVNKIEGRTLASLAIADGAVYLRSETHLYRIELPPADQPKHGG